MTTFAEAAPIVVRLRPIIDLSDDEFFELCQANKELRFERTAEGDVIIMTPASGRSGRRNIEFAFQLVGWSKADGTGVAFDSSTGFTLPSGAVRSPDAAWVRHERLADLTDDQREKFLPLCPDFVVEIRSPSDRLSDLEKKMEEYIANGAQLGWLIDPVTRRVLIYRPDHAVEHLDGAPHVGGDPILPAFTLDLDEIWTPSF